MVTCRLHHPLSVHHPFAVLLVAAPGQVVLEHRCSRFLDLQEERVPLIATLQQDDERPGADTSDANNLPGDVDHMEPLQQVTPIGLQRGAVRANLIVDRCPPGSPASTASPH